MIISKRSLCVPARFASLASLLAPLATNAGLDGLERTNRAGTLLRAQTVVEELFANTIQHGYQGESDNLVWLAISPEDGQLKITYADAAPPYDPLADLSAAPLIIDDLGHANRIGGAGRYLVAQLPDRCHYQRREGRNELVCEFDWRG